MENTNMNLLLNYINKSEDKAYTFCIEKYLYNKLQCRSLPKRGDITTTWEKYIWDETQTKWRITHYRYQDEVSESIPDLFVAATKVDDEWTQFMRSIQRDQKNVYEDSLSEEEVGCQGDKDQDNEEVNQHKILTSRTIPPEAPEASSIYISTQTKIAYLNQMIDLTTLFWKIPILSYHAQQNGIIKKQMKIVCLSQAELDAIHQQLETHHSQDYVDQHTISNTDNVEGGRLPFKYVGKISVGISKKDMTSVRCKRKGAFYNCIVLIMRLQLDDVWKEFHIKVFNTGKLEIPGIQQEATFQRLLQEVLHLLRPFLADRDRLEQEKGLKDGPEQQEKGLEETRELLDYKPDSEETVLINSNFKCGFYIDRDVLHELLKTKYNIQCMFDPCSYPGIQCKFHFNPDVLDTLQTGHPISEANTHHASYQRMYSVSFMIFRTGSVLIVGKCGINVLLVIYDFLKTILRKEYPYICQAPDPGGVERLAKDTKPKKARRRIILVE